MSDSRKWRHDIRSSLNGVICMGSILGETDLTDDQADILKYMMTSAEKALELLEEVPGQDDPSRKELPGKSQKAEEYNPEYRSRGEREFRVLVAEDDDINRLYLTTILKRENWVIDEASDGFQAVEMTDRRHYQMILMDVSMPGLDGIQAARRIREKNTTTPILAITAHGLQDLNDDFRDAGMDEVLRKPISEDNLIRVIKKLTRGETTGE